MNQIAEAERARGGPDQGISLHTKVNLAAIARGKDDDADMRDQDKEIAALVTRLNSIQGLMATYSTLASATSDPNQITTYMSKVVGYESQVVGLNKDLAELSTRKRKRNPIVEEVLAHGARSMGIAEAPSKPSSETAGGCDSL